MNAKTVYAHPSLEGYLQFLADQPWLYLAVFGVLVVVTMIWAKWAAKNLI